MADRRKTRVRLRRLRIRELAFVDRPAVPAARFVLAKRTDRLTKVEAQTVHRLLFDGRAFAEAEASAWASSRGYVSAPVKVTDGGQTLEILQRDEDEFDPNGQILGVPFRTVELEDGVRAVVGILKKRVESDDLTPDQEETLDRILARLQPPGDQQLTPHERRRLEEINRRLQEPLTPEEERRLDVIRDRLDGLFPKAPDPPVVPSADVLRLSAFMGRR